MLILGVVVDTVSKGIVHLAIPKRSVLITVLEAHPVSFLFSLTGFACRLVTFSLQQEKVTKKCRS